MLTLVPTPIGNLKDITLRGLEVIFEADIILCEDTRVTKKLLTLLDERFSHILDFGVSKRESKQFISFHSHNQSDFLAHLDSAFFTTNNVVYMSDAGMPSICDPGALLVQYAQAHNIHYEVLPGCCALALAYCFSGVDSQGFIFGGFLPHKQNERKQKIQSLLDSNLPIIVYESPHRILQTLKDIDSLIEDIAIFAIKEMTKLHQKSFIGTAKEILCALEKENTQGEWVIVINAYNTESKLSFSYDEILSLPLPPKLQSKLLAQISNKDAKTIYKELMERQ